jgi:hypothetical protein
MISPTLLNEVAFNLNGNWIDLTPLGIYQQPAGWSATSLFDHNALNRLPTVSIGGSYGVNYDPASWPWRNAAWDKQDQRLAQHEVRRPIHALFEESGYFRRYAGRLHV